jgi:tetratricopeptide (TPR) repeat protein
MDRMAGKAYNNLGYSLMLRGQKDEAVKAFMEALGPLKRAGDERGEAITLFNLADLLHERGERTRAKELLEQAAALMKKNGLASEARAAELMLERMRAVRY